MVGGAGNDTYYVDDAADQVIEKPAAASTAFSPAPATPWRPVRRSRSLRAFGAGATAGVTLSRQRTCDNYHDRWLRSRHPDRAGPATTGSKGGAAADTMVGGTGNDTYYVDDAADQVIEKAGGGIDRIYASTSYTLVAGRRSSD